MGRSAGEEIDNLEILEVPIPWKRSGWVGIGAESEASNLFRRRIQKLGIGLGHFDLSAWCL